MSGNGLHRPPHFGMGVLLSRTMTSYCHSPAAPARSGFRSPFAAARYRSAHDGDACALLRNTDLHHPRSTATGCRHLDALGEDHRAGRSTRGDMATMRRCRWLDIFQGGGVDQRRSPVETRRSCRHHQIAGLAHPGMRPSTNRPSSRLSTAPSAHSCAMPECTDQAGKGEFGIAGGVEQPNSGPQRLHWRPSRARHRLPEDNSPAFSIANWTKARMNQPSLAAEASAGRGYVLRWPAASPITICLSGNSPDVIVEALGGFQAVANVDIFPIGSRWTKIRSHTCHFGSASRSTRARRVILMRAGKAARTRWI